MPFLKKVVVGEDDDAIAHLIEATLGDAGWLCLRGRDGLAALTLTVQESPDLLILDVLMPKLDGLQTVKRLKADPIWSKVPVLMLTALGSVDERVRGLEAGADDYLTKPFDLRELMARAQALTRASRRERDRSPTTDLPGPGTFDDGLQAWLDSGAAFGLVFVEIEGFDRVSDAQGWPVGEALLKRVGEALRGAVADAPSTLLTHLGGDDFAIVAPAADAAALAERARAAADAALQPQELRSAVTVVDSDGARSVADLAAKVATARTRRGR